MLYIKEDAFRTHRSRYGWEKFGLTRIEKKLAFIDCIFFRMASMAAGVECQAEVWRELLRFDVISLMPLDSGGLLQVG